MVAVYEIEKYDSEKVGSFLWRTGEIPVLYEMGETQ